MGTKKGVEAAGVAEPTQVAPTLVEQGEASGKAESIGRQVAETAAEGKTGVAEIVVAVEEKIAATEEKLTDAVAEVKGQIVEVAEKIEAEIAQAEADVKDKVVEATDAVERRKKAGCC